jgi:DNA-directed RNA polymerase III subunit RPC1
LPFEILEIVDYELSQPKFQTECTAAYIATIRAFILDSIVRRMASFRQKHGMFDAEEREDEWDEYTDMTMGASSMCVAHWYCVFPLTFMDVDAQKVIVDNKAKVTEAQVRRFLEISLIKYIRAKIEPGGFVK